MKAAILVADVLAIRRRWKPTKAVANAPGLTTDFVESQEFHRNHDVRQKLVDLLAAAGLPRPHREKNSGPAAGPNGEAAA